MKFLVAFLTTVFFITNLLAQPPEKISYQAVVRNSSNQLVTNTAIGMQISILQGSAEATAVYVEHQFPTTNENGLVTLMIGDGTLISGDFGNIDWSSGPFFLKTETDPNGEANYTITGTSEILSVPYALYANQASSLAGTMGMGEGSGLDADLLDGYHSEHFMTSDFEESDPFYSTSAASGIDNTDTTHWNQAYSWGNHADAGYTSGDPSFNIDISSANYNMQVIHPSLRLIGRLKSKDNQPVEGQISVEVTIYDEAEGGDALWSEDQDIDVSNGFFEIIMGTEQPLEDHFFRSNYSLYLGLIITIDGNYEEFTKRIELTRNDGWTMVSEYAKHSEWEGILNNPFKIYTYEQDQWQNNDMVRYETGDGWVQFTPDFASGDHAHDDIYAALDHTHDSATAGADGFMSSEDKVKLDSIKTYKVGDFAQGGVVFWVDESGQHGLVCAIEDQDGGSGIKWRGGSTDYKTNALGDGIYAGEMNTSVIVAVHSANGDLDDHAALLCANYDGGGYGDWYLPSFEELKIMRQNKSIIDATATANGGSAFANAYYWSSVEFDGEHAVSHSLENFNYGHIRKYDLARVHAVRAF